MKPIPVTPKNLDKLQEAITLAEGRTSARQITAAGILDAAAHITDVLRIPKKSMVGIVASVDLNAQRFPNAYKYTPESTHFTLEYSRTGWTLTSVFRDVTRPPTRVYVLSFPEAARQALISRFSTLDRFSD